MFECLFVSTSSVLHGCMYVYVSMCVHVVELRKIVRVFGANAIILPKMFIKKRNQTRHYAAHTTAATIATTTTTYVEIY